MRVIADRAFELHCDQVGQHRKAIKHLERARAIAQELDDHSQDSLCLRSLGSACCGLEQFERAVECLTQALGIHRNQNDTQAQGQCLNDLGTAYLGLKQHDLAIDCLMQALRISHSLEDLQNESSIFGSLGMVYDAQGLHEEVVHYVSHRLALSRKTGDVRGEASSWAGLGRAYYRIGSTETAIEHLTHAEGLYTAIWEDLMTDERRVAFGDGGLAATMIDLQRALIGCNRQVDALACSERARSRALELLLAQQRLGHNSDSAAAHTRYQNTATPIDVVTMQAIASKQKSALLIYSRLSPTLVVAWLVGSTAVGEVVMKQLSVSTDDISVSQLVHRTRRTIIGRHGLNGAEVQGYARDLAALDSTDSEDENEVEDADNARCLLKRTHELLIEPFIEALASEHRLIIIPDRELYALPFAALVDRDGSYLIERCAITMAPSVGTIVELERRAKLGTSRVASGIATIVGDPNFHGCLRQLNGARDEAEEIYRLFEGLSAGSATKLLGDDASKPRVLAAMHTSEYVHLATHGVATGVYLAGHSKEECKLTLGEVQSLELGASKLVVLSECDSFRGEIGTEGVVGIARAFAVAGARSIIASLWNVEDESTRDLMVRFYRHFLPGGEADADAALALQKAIISMLRERQYSVLQWGAFVVYGSPISAALDQEPPTLALSPGMTSAAEGVRIDQNADAHLSDNDEIEALPGHRLDDLIRKRAAVNLTPTCVESLRRGQEILADIDDRMKISLDGCWVIRDAKSSLQHHWAHEAGQSVFTGRLLGHAGSLSDATFDIWTWAIRWTLNTHGKPEESLRYEAELNVTAKPMTLVNGKISLGITGEEIGSFSGYWVMARRAEGRDADKFRALLLRQMADERGWTHAELKFIDAFSQPSVNARMDALFDSVNHLGIVRGQEAVYERAEGWNDRAKTCARVHDEIGWSAWDSMYSATSLKRALVNVVMVDAEWLVELASQGGVLPRCQDVPVGAVVSFIEMQECSTRRGVNSNLTGVGVLAISSPGVGGRHPDPEGEYLRRISPVLQAFVNKTRWSGGDGTRVGVFWPYVSIPQENIDGVDDRTDDEKKRAEDALAGNVVQTKASVPPAHA